MVAIANFVPMTGRGAFDCSYIPGTGILMLTVNIFANFENRPIEGISWSEPYKSKFKTGAQTSIQRNWNGKFRFINRHRNPTEIVVPYFGVRFVSEGEASVLMRVPRYASAYGLGNLARCDSYVGLEQINTGNRNAQATGMVHSETTEPINVKLTEAPNISRDERRRIEEIVTALGVDAIPLTPSGALTPQINVDLANFVARVKMGPPSRPLVPIIVDVRFNQGAGASSTNAIKQGRAIRDKLRSFHLNNPVEYRFLNDLSLGNGGRIAIVPDLSFEATFDDDMWMDIFAHEYGHMLGLPDEYDALPPPTSNVPKDLAINRFLGMTDLYGTPRPAMGRMTTSIMCKGRDILPCHMITALQALRRLTTDEDWRVF